ncbi:hypothetical protein, partial [Paracoccus sp. (in: a-proteobacteria)]|uniref:hypothetical protein n=1 Tax=Paracoccus sp. TaxID=267 RepID=UPI0028AB3583
RPHIPSNNPKCQKAEETKNLNNATLMAKFKPSGPRIFEPANLQGQLSDPLQRLAASVKRYLGAGDAACKRKNARLPVKNCKAMI